MILNKNLRKGLATLMAGALAASAALPALAVTPGPDGLAGAGQETYISMHEYVSKTDIDGVYKVTLSVGGDIKQRNTEVVVLLDNSSSMNLDASLNHNYSSLPGNENAEDLMNAMMGPGLVDDDLYGYGYADAAYWLYPFSSDYADIAKHRADSLTVGGFTATTGTVNGPGTNGMGDPGFDDMMATTGGVWSAGVHDYLQVMWGLYNFSISGGIPPTDFDYDWNPFAIQFGNKAQTRLGAAAAGVDYALNTFSDARKNPGITRTTLGMVSFSGPIDSFNSPYWDSGFILAAPGNYGFAEAATSPSYLAAGAGMIVPASGTGYQLGMMSGVRYSTRMDTGAPPYMYYQTQAGFGGTLLKDYAKHLADRVTNLVYVDSKYPTAGASSQNAKGLIPMSSSADVTTLRSDMDFFVRAATMDDNGTWILDGLNEVERLFWGSGGATKNLTDGSGDLDKPNRYVILLTDGDDTAGAGLEALDKINEMKNMGVQFMVMAIDSGVNPATAGYDPTDLDEVLTYIGANLGTTNPSVANNTDLTPWLALAAMPIEAQITHPTTGQQLWFEIGDIGTGALGSIPGTPGVDQLATGTTWAATDFGGYNFSAIPTLRQNQSKSPTFAFIPSTDPSRIQSVFEGFVDQIVKMGQGTKVDAKLSAMFDVYQKPGEPMFSVNGVAAGANEVFYNGKTIDWRLINEIPLTGITTLSFYVKMGSGADNSLHYPVFDKAVLTSTGPFYREGDNPVAPFRDIFITKSFAGSFVAPNGGIKQESTEEDVTSDAKDSGYTGKDGHQDNRKSATDTANYTGNVLDITPNISGLDTGTGLNGRSKVIVKVANGANMRYQWQVKSESGEWEDIFGATSSQYTLSNKFKVGQEYELRCKITNAAGKVTITDSIKVLATAVGKGEGLQSK